VIAWVGTPLNVQEASIASRYVREPALVSELDELSKNTFTAYLQSFGNAPFWERAWIIRELAVGEPVDVRFGNLNISWLMLKIAMLNSEIRNYLHLVPDFHAFILMLDRFQSRERDSRVGEKRVSLLGALFESRNSISTHHRDKIYALLGLSSDGDGFVDSPNYYESVSRLAGQRREFSTCV
jgi:hypothetical protein